ncbi:MAG: hypothetical protein ABIO63_10145 [Casimicrobiaceae bacterium]
MTTTIKTSWTEKLVMVAITLAIGVGSLELVAGSMSSPAPETIAAKRQFIAAEEARANQIRTLEAGEVRFAGASLGRAN